MFILFTPFSYLFLTVYLLVLYFMLTLDNFYVFWLYMEVAMLLFMGLSYTIFVHSYTQLMLYFLMQTLASFSMLVFYTLGFHFLFYFALFLKLGMFPFMSWYLNVLFRFPSFTLLISSTLHKLPPLFLFYLVFNSTYSDFVLVSILASLLIGGIYMLTVIDLRYLLIVSSMANNSFLLLSLMTGSLFSFSFFFTIYFFTMLFLLLTLKGVMKPLIYSSNKKVGMTFFLLSLLLNMAAIPPFPMFLAKFIVVYDYFYSFNSSFFILVLLVLLNVFMMASYCQFFMKFVTYIYSNSSTYLLR